MEYKRCYRLLTFRLCWLFILQTLGCITRLNVHCAHKETLAEPQVTSCSDAAPERKLIWQQVTSQTSAQLQLFNCFPQAKKNVLISPSTSRLTPVFTLFTPTLSEPPIMSTNQTATEGKERGRLKHRRREREIQTASERIINAQCVFWCRRAEKCSRRLMSSQTATLWCLKRRRNKKQKLLSSPALPPFCSSSSTLITLSHLPATWLGVHSMKDDTLAAPAHPKSCNESCRITYVLRSEVWSQQNNLDVSLIRR